MFDAAKISGAEVLAGAASPLWGPTWALCIVGLVLSVPGGLAVYGYFAASRVEPLARAGFILSTIDVVLWMPLVSFMGFTGAAAAGFPQAAPVLVATVFKPAPVLVATVFKDAGGLVILFAVVAQISGWACTGVAMWRTTRLPKWTGPAKLLAGVLFALELFPGGVIVASALVTAVSAQILWVARCGEFPEDRAALEAIAVART